MVTRSHRKLRERRSALITQRSQVQILPPQPILEINDLWPPVRVAVFVGAYRQSEIRRPALEAVLLLAKVERLFAFLRNCGDVIAFPNHLSGNPSPSPQDLEFTTKLASF